MGKSPGRWIKTVLFGKKYSKSNLSKSAHSDTKAAVKIPVGVLNGNSPVQSDPRCFNDRDAENVEIENDTSGILCDTVALSPVNHGVETQSNFVFSVPENDAEMRKQDQAATKVQAALRGYLARRAFRALNGIIRLQALIRGHLVRRQAVATFRCMQAVVKFQALARGQNVRLSDTRPETGRKYMGHLQVTKQVDIGARSVFSSDKLGMKPYIHELLLSMPTAMPLSLQYDLDQPNSAWNWLERWSFSRFWEPPAGPKPASAVKPQRNRGGSQIVEKEAGKLKRSIRKASSAENGDYGASANRNPRKVTSHQKDLVQQQPQNELERVKRNLRKVSASLMTDSEKSEMETDKPQRQLTDKTLSKHAALDVSEQEIVVSSENQADSDIAVVKLALPEAASKPSIMDVPQNVPHDDHNLVEAHSSENGEKMKTSPSLHEELISKEEETGKENRKIQKRRSLPAKQEYPENISQNTPRLPSYMAATESAKAKLRAQGSSKFSKDGAEYGYDRRHSLPASASGRLSSLSPRIQRLVQANGKGSNKPNRSMTASRDDNVLQPGWRR